MKPLQQTVRNTLQFDLLEAVDRFYRLHRADCQVYCMCLLAALFAYGDKVFFRSYATDDYSRFFAETTRMNLFTGRWAAQLLTDNVFNRGMHILPYANTVLSLSLITLAGLLTARCWKVKGRLATAITVCILTISPYWAHNLRFNTNTTVAFGMLFGVLAVYLVLRSRKAFFWAPLFFVLSAGIYQSTLQAAAIVAIGAFFVRMADTRTWRDLSRRVGWLVAVAFIMLLSFYLSNCCSRFGVPFAGVQPANPAFNRLLEQVGTRETLLAVVGIHKKMSIYDYYFGVFAPAAMNYRYYVPIVCSVLAFVLIGIFGFLTRLRPADPDEPARRWFPISKIALTVTGIWAAVLAVLISEVAGRHVPARAYFAASTFAALVFVMATLARWALIRSVATLFAVALVLLSCVYISLIFDAASRQTLSDIIRANQIANRIRVEPQYHCDPDAPPYFLIVGKTDVFGVIGNHFAEGQVLNTKWSRYAIFKHFSDFRFRQPTASQQAALLEKLKQIDGLGEYPNHGSIQFIDNAIILILDLDALHAPHL